MAFDDADVICFTGSKLLIVRNPEGENALPQLMVISQRDADRIEPHWHINPDLLDLKDETSFHIHVIISTLSGTQQANAFYEALLRPFLEELGIDARCEVTRTTSADTITTLTKTRILPAATAGRAQLLILLSGDGGVSDLLNALHPPDPPDQPDRPEAAAAARPAAYRAPQLALLPLGTGNALAHDARLAPPADPTCGLAALARGAPTPLPIFTAAFSPGAVLQVSSVSADAAAAANENGNEDGNGNENGNGSGKGAEAEAEATIVAETAPRTEPLPQRDAQGRPALHGAVVCSWGLHAGLVADSDGPEFRAFGAARFGMAARAALFPPGGGGPHRYRGCVEVLLPLPSPSGNEEEVEEDVTREKGDEEKGARWVAVQRSEHAYVLGTLVGCLEKGFTISPSSRSLDGRLWLVHFGPRDGDEVMRLMGLAYQGGGHVQDHHVVYEEVEGFKISFNMEEADPKWRRICVDGKTVVVEENGWVEVRKTRQELLSIRHIPQT